MSKVNTDWRKVYQYSGSKAGKEGEGYWLFAPFLKGEIELFQASFLLNASGLMSVSSSVATSTGSRKLSIQGDPDAADLKIAYANDAFRLDVGRYLTFSSEAPDRYRIQTWDPENLVRADVEIRPASKLLWTIPGSHYFTTLDSVLEGSIKIAGRLHEVKTLCAFEHSCWGIPGLGEARFPPFWQYEYVQWAGAEKPFGTFLWNILDAADNQLQSSGFHKAYPANDVTGCDRYSVAFKDVEDYQGKPLPRTWDVKSSNGDESFNYTAKVRTVLHSLEGMFTDVLLFTDVLIDCEGIYRGPEGETPLRGRGRTEYICKSYNPANK